MTRDGGTRDTRRRTKYDIVLFIILMTLLFMPLLQGRFHLIPLKPLNGVTIETEKPDFNIASYRSGDYAKQEEAYWGEHFGFREPIIRLYNQYLWSCYKKTYAHDVTAGKQGWLFTPESVSDYYGTELLRWQPSVEEARSNFEREVRYMCRVREILKENNVELLAFIAPEKSFVYPEYLPDGEHDTTTFDACAYFLRGFEENGFPCIDMTRWFGQMKDTVPYPLIPQTGAHWVFPAVYAADSLFRFMGDLKGIELPKLKIGELHENDDHGSDNELERLLNLVLPIRKRQGYSPTADVTAEAGPNSVKPKVLFIGNSFMWGMANHVPMREVFGDVEFWYYFSTAYTGEDLTDTQLVVDLNLLEKLLDFDYMVWFTTGNQLNKGTNGFANSVMLTLGVDNSLRLAYVRHIADTLTMEGSDTLRRREAYSILLRHPDLIPELHGDSLTTQNSEIPYARYTKDIRKDSLWMEALEAQAFLRTASLAHILEAEADHLREGQPLYRDQQAEVAFGLQCLREVETLKQKMTDNKETMATLRRQSEERGITLEQSMEGNAKWLIRRKYHLDQCRFLDNPESVIPIPDNFH